MKTTSIQVVPVIEHAGHTGLYTATVEAQPEGPTEDTTGWAVYERKEDGTASWFADIGNETHAMWLGWKLATYHGVDIEPQPWVKSC